MMIAFNKRIFIRLSYVVIDIFCMVVSFYFASLLNYNKLPFDVTLHDLFVSHSNPYRFIFILWISISILLLSSYKLYQTRREVLEGVELWLVTKAIGVSSLAMSVAIFILDLESFSRAVFILSTVFIIASLSLWRVLKRAFVFYLVKSGYNNFNVLIVGAGKVGRALEDEVKKRPELGLKIVGFLDDFKTDKDIDSDTKIIGKISDFQNIARKEFIHKVFITIHHNSDVFLSLLEMAKELEVTVRVVPEGFQLTGCDFQKYNIGFIPILEYFDTDNTTKQFGKRIFDFVLSLTASIFFLPVFVLIGILIKLDSRGPVLYVSKRYGCRGNKFNMYKFRSMVISADEELEKLKKKNEVDGPIFKIKNDPRITKMGRFLRRYSLDEVPQVFNVLKGEMSLVGPRPLPINQVEREDYNQLKRLGVRPGITGLWQIRGRSDISFSRLVKWDIWYINNWSFWLDLNILFQTIPVVFKGRGAY